MKMLLLRNPETKEMVCVPKADHMVKRKLKLCVPHEDWELLEERNGPPPEHAEWVDGKGWVVDKALKTTKNNEAKLHSMSRTELVEYILELVKKEQK